MLIAVLLDSDDQIVAIAPACDQQPFGNRYWTEIYAGRLSPHAGWQTAYVRIDDRDLVERIDQVPYDDAQLEICARLIARQFDVATWPVDRAA